MRPPPLTPCARIAAPHELRPPPPPALKSSEYAKAFNEVKATGRIDSETRTPEQTGFPEYVSAQSAGCGASFAILATSFGRRTAFTMATTTAPPGMPTRSFRSFSVAVDECADSRVRLGFHFRYATDAGKRLGRRVARRVVRHRFEPLAHSSSARMR